ncbi:flippase [Pseudomonas sp. phDV1]|nr:flippase [Pseudomonas sp. phDV1]AXO61384.1 flippase [Pseudomonas sp. phDV1]
MAIINKIKGLVQHQGFRRYAANTSWMMAEQMLRIIAGLLVGIWVARYLGPQQFGLFSYVLAFTAIFAGIAKLGLDGILVRDLVNQPENRDIYLGTAFWLKVFGAFLVIGLMAIITPFTSNDATTNLFIFIVAGGLVFQSFEVVEFYFQSKVLAKIVSICKVTQLTLSSLIKIYLVITQADLFWFVCVTAFDTFSLGVSYFVAYKIRGNASFFKCFNISIAKQLLKDSWPLIFSAFSVGLAMRIDQIMISEFQGDYEVGIYSAGVRLAEGLAILAVVVSTSLYPMIIKRVYSKSYNDIKSLIRAGFYGLIFLAAIVAFLSSEIILLLFGMEYKESDVVLAILIFSIPFTYLNIITTKVLTAENKAADVMWRQFALLLINVSLNFIFIPKYGVIGAAIATLLSDLIISVFMDIIFKRNRVFGLLKVKAIIGW